MSALTPEARRCAETRAHYAHRWVQAVGVTGLYVDCPGGPDEGALIAEAVDQARAEERERIATAIEGQRPRPDDHGRWSKAAYSAALTHAARIARGEVSP